MIANKYFVHRQYLFCIYVGESGERGEHVNFNEQCYFNLKNAYKFSFLRRKIWLWFQTYVLFTLSYVLFFFISVFINAAVQCNTMRGECCHLSTMHTLVSVVGTKSISLYCSTILHQLRNLLRKIFFLQCNIILSMYS